MRHIWLLALVAAITFTAGMIAVFGDTDRARPQIAVVTETTTPLDQLASSTTVVVMHADLIGSDPLSADEEAILEELLATTTTMATTTTTIPVETTAAASVPRSSSPAPAPTATTTPPPPPAPAGQFRGDYEADFYGRINSLRGGAGLPALNRSGSLDSYARSWAKKMAEAGDLSHSNLSSLLGSWSAAGENVGKGGSVSSVFNALNSSSGHYSVMVGNFTHVGVGVWQAGNGVLWTVHVFAG